MNNKTTNNATRRESVKRGDGSTTLTMTQARGAAASKVKWTKKFKAVIISLSLAFAVALGGAFTAVGVTLANKNALRGGTFAGGVADDNSVTPPSFAEGETVEIKTAADWATVIAAQSSADSYAVAKLTANLTANSSTHLFGEGTANTDPYYNGALNVPAGKYVILDLNGYTVNRGLTEATENGSVITNYGNLVINDTSAKANGKITGGNNSGKGGGVYTEGTLTILNGSITANTARFGGGVYTTGNLSAYGGNIDNNKAKAIDPDGSATDYDNGGRGAGILALGANVILTGTAKVNSNVGDTDGGGVHVREKSSLTMGGTAEICNNVANTVAGGIYVIHSSTFTMNNGKISGNSTVIGDGAGVCISNGTTVINSGEISNNSAGLNAGGIYCGSGTLTINGGTISDNTANTDRGCGGGIEAVKTKVIIKDAIIENNSAADGGGIYVAQGQAANGEYDLTISGNTVFTKNTSKSGGGGVYINSSKLLIESGTITENSATRGGGIQFTSGSSGNIIGGTISDNVGSVAGGGIYEAAGATLVIGSEDGTKYPTFTGNKNVSSNSEYYGGGAIYQGIKSELTINNAVMNNNSTTSRGGAIYVAGSARSEAADETKRNTITIKNITVNNNSAVRYGGGLYTYYCVDVIVEKGIFSNNVSENADGGGLLTNDDCTLVLGTEKGDKEAVQFIGNSANNGGGVFAGSATIWGAKFSENKANKEAGGFFCRATNSTVVEDYFNGATIHNATVTDNTSGTHGGGVYIQGTATVTIENITVTDNTATDGDGGGIFSAGDLTVKSGTISGNYAGGAIDAGSYKNMRGGGIWHQKGALIIGDPDDDKKVVNFTDNKAAWSGGAIYAYSGTITALDIYNAKFENNQAIGGDGGAICAVSTPSSVNSTIKGCEFKGNTATSSGGALYNTGAATYNYENVVVKNNTAGSNGGGFYNTSPVNITGSTITGNSARSYGGGIYVGGNTTRVTDSTIGGTKAYNANATDKTDMGNSAQNGGGIYNGGALDLTKIVISGNTAVNDAGGIYQNGKLRILGKGGNPDGAGAVQEICNNEIKGNTAGQLTNNLYFAKNKGLEIHCYPRQDMPDVGISMAEPGRFITGCAEYADFKNDGTQKGFFPDNKDNYQIVQTVENSRYSYDLKSKISGTMAERWVAAINASKNNGGAQQVFEMTDNWTANASTGFGTAGTTGFGTSGALNVPEGANIVLDLKGYTLDKSAATGTVIYVLGTLTIKGSGTITGGTVGSGGGALAVYSGNLTLNGGTIKGNTSGGYGGAVCVDSAGTFTMNGGSIVGNTATGNGGGVYVDKATFTMNGGTIGGSAANKNTATNGGGIYAQGNSNVTINGGTISYNSATNTDNSGSGGGLYLNSSNLVMTGGTISNNTADDDGAGICMSGTATISGGRINDNATTLTNSGHTGGGIFVSGTNTTLNLTGGSVQNNVACQGGGIFVTSGATLNLGAVKTENNKTTYSGSAVIGNNRYTSSAGGICIGTGSTLNFYGGTTAGNYVVTASAPTTKVTSPASGVNGGGIYNNGTVKMYGGTISGNSAYNGAGVIDVNNATFDMYGGEISGNTATSTGGGVYVHSNGAFNLNDGKISGNTATTGGGVYQGSQFYMRGGEISGNTANAGGGLYNGAWYSQMDNGVIKNNTATKADDNSNALGSNVYTAGRFWMKNGTITVSGGTANCIATGVYVVSSQYTSNKFAFEFSGGTITKSASDTGHMRAIVVTATGVVNMSKGEVTGFSSNDKDYTPIVVYNVFNMTGGSVHNNCVVSNGGAFLVKPEASLNVSGSAKIYDNTAGTVGGAVYIAENGELNVSGGTIYNNTAGTSGGAIYVAGGTFTMSAGTISGNKSLSTANGTGGGGICIVDATATITGGTFDSNHSDGHGGAIYLKDDSENSASAIISVQGATFTGNTSGLDGGALNISGDVTALSDCTFTGNTSERNGGAVMIWSKSEITVSDITITGNRSNSLSSGGGGGGLVLGNGVKVTLQNAEISDNYAELDGGGIGISNSTLIFGANVTVSGNTAEGSGGGIRVSPNNTTFEFRAGTISGNTATNGGGVYNAGTTNFYGGDGAPYDVFVTGNTATGNGGGVYIASGATSNFYGGQIDGNTATENGGGVYNEGTFTVSAGVIGGANAYDASATDKSDMGNFAGYNAGGVYLAKGATFGLKGAIVSNHAENLGGGIYSNGNVNMTGGEISKNTTTHGAAGIYQQTPGTFTMTDGAISDNVAGTHIGGILVATNATFVMSGGEITGNTATSGVCGGVWVDGTFNVSGKVIIEDNENSDGGLSNVYLNTNKKINITGTLNATSVIGVSAADAESGRVLTSGLNSKGGIATTAFGDVIIADQDGYSIKNIGGEAALGETVSVTLTSVGLKGDREEVTKLWVDKGGNMTFDVSRGTNMFTFNYTYASATAGALNKMTKVTAPTPDGYEPYLTLAGSDGEGELTNELLQNISAAKEIEIHYRAIEVEYVVYYLLQKPDGTYFEPTENLGYDAAAGSNNPYVEKAFVKGLTDTYIKPLAEGGLPHATTNEFLHPEEYTLDTGKPLDTTERIAGDGSTEVVVYLKLNEYTVTYRADGDAVPATQTRRLRYGAALVAPAREPNLPLSTFVGWYLSTDETQTVINFATTDLTVTGNITLIAKFDMETFHVYFDMNLGTGENQLPRNTQLVVRTNDGLSEIGTYAAWNYEGLFPAESGFNFRYNTEEVEGVDAADVYVIDYTIVNIPYTKSIRTPVPTAVGYTFSGWYIGNRQVNSIYAPYEGMSDEEKNTVLTAHWTPTLYNVSYDKQDGSWNPVITKQATNGDSLENVLPEEPTRTGYVFDGWYITTDVVGGTTVEDAMRGTGRFAVGNIANLYGNAEEGYDFSNITFYAKWNSVDVYINCATGSFGSLSFANENNHNGTIGVAAQAMHVGDTVRISATVANGYKYDHITVTATTATGATREYTFTDEFVIRDTYLKDYTLNGNDYKVVEITPTFSEQSYTITYVIDGGTSTSTGFARTYTPSSLIDDPSNRNRTTLPNRLTKQGYDFMGWKFTDSGEKAFLTDSGVDTTKDLFGETLYLDAPTNENGNVVYRNISLTAIWEAQPATVYLYTFIGSIDVYPNYDADNECYILDESEGAKTDATIYIQNPERTSFDFLGWATSRNGVVVYPAEEGSDTIEYKVSADYDVNKKPLNRNNLYAVWHIKGVDRVNISVANNGTTYGGSGITMTATPAQSYDAGDGAAITLTYKWYRIFGNYDDCFTVGSVYINDDKVTGYSFEENGVMTYYDAYMNKLENQSQIPAGEAFEYRRFDESSAAGTNDDLENTDKNCVLVSTQPNSGEKATLTVKNVNDCGIYVCVVEVTATIGGDATTRTGGYGEIEISMSKAVYNNLTLSNVTTTYNAESQAEKMVLARRSTTDGSSFEADEDGIIRYVKLPDGCRVMVTYSYYTLTGTTRNDIADLNEVKNVGTYYVEVTFAFASDGTDKGNYEPLAKMEAELVITPFEINSISYTFVHGEERDTENFNGDYDGEAYTVEAAINDRFDHGNRVVTEISDVKLTVIVNTVNENGDTQIAANRLPTVDSGSYSVQVTGLEGADAGNFVLKSTNLRKEYSIGKSVYEVSGHIHLISRTDEYDDNEHILEITFDEGYSLPATVTARYTTEYETEYDGFTDSSFNPNSNVGTNAGVYTVTVEFVDSASANYMPLESMTATLTIKKVNLFEHFEEYHGVDLLDQAGFVGGSYAYTGETMLPNINSNLDCELNKDKNFKVTYEYYLVDDDTGARTKLDSRTIDEPGKYEIVAKIAYANATYRNNFLEVQDNESTITYVIRNFDVTGITVVFTDEFESSGRIVKLGETFKHEWIKEIVVEYTDNESGSQGTRRMVDDEDIALALLSYGKKSAGDSSEQTSFWHVGTFDIRVSVYGSGEGIGVYQVTVKQEIEEVELLYRVAGSGNSFAPIPEDGLELLTEGEYEFIITYDCVTDEGLESSGESNMNVKAAGLKLGKNVLDVEDDAENSAYIFGEISVYVYKVINEAETTLVWKYSLDGKNWSDIVESDDGYVLEYTGQEYTIGVEFEDGGSKHIAVAATSDGSKVLNYRSYAYDMRVGRSVDGDYVVNANLFSIAVSRRVVTVNWSANSFVYNGMYQAPEATITNVAAVDEGLLTFSYEFEDTEGGALSEGEVIGAGTYVIKLVLDAGNAANGNYTVIGSATAVKTFAIGQADIDIKSVTYSEYNYGAGVTFAGNRQGLRIDALSATFGQASVDGDFKFIKFTNGEKTEFEIIDGDDDSIKTKLANKADSVNIDYAYIPRNTRNYKTKIGQFNVTVREQTRKTGVDSLIIVLGEGSTPHYLMGATFTTAGISVYRACLSYYVEGDEWYGQRYDVASPSLTLSDNQSADGHEITSEVVSGGNVTLTARSGSNSGSILIPVIDKVPISLELTTEAPKAEFYVGETYSFAGLTFLVTFDDHTDQELSSASVICDFDGKTFTTEGTQIITFSYFGAETTLDVTVKAKEDLQIVQFTNSEKLLVLTGGTATVPDLKFLIDGVEYTEYEGITVTRVVMKGQSTVSEPLTEKGNYKVYYTITITNPRFNAIYDYPPIDMEVTDNPYQVTVNKPAAGELSVEYTGENIEIPKPISIVVIDSRTGATLNETDYTVTYTINNGTPLVGSAITAPWNRKNVGTYKVVITVEVEGLSRTDEYTFEITKATNGDMTLAAGTVILGDGANFRFPVTAKFLEDDSVVEYQYREVLSGNTYGSYVDVPNKAGMWQVKVTIRCGGTIENFTEIFKEAMFEVRDPSAEATTDNGSISGGNGIGKGWTLTITQMSAEKVSEVSINKQNVLDGYTVLLENHDVTIENEGEYTVRIKLGEELAGRNDLKVFFKSANRTAQKSAKVVRDGDDTYLEFRTSEFGSFIITSAQPGEPVGLLVAVIVLGVLAAGGIAACIIVFVKKRKGARK
ncbi:MAG: InlB B-repeat-containing protein [Clostridiales bacterium]|nr:InlB B-repeat-containing protein [Clostridiales bacterium]